MKTMEFEFNIPSYLVYAFEYGDISGLEDHDIQEYDKIRNEIDDIVKYKNYSHMTFQWSEQSYFTHTPYFHYLGILPCEVTDVIVTVFEKE